MSTTTKKPLTREEVFALARKIAQTPYDAAAEPTVKIPDYNGAENNPHAWVAGNADPPAERRKIRKLNECVDSALDLVGNTPLVRLARLSKALGIEHHELMGKVEFFSAGGSTKDRIALRMIEDAEESGRIKPGDTLIEPTSGNTGIGLCLAAAVKGYNIIITMPKKMSGEKLNTMETLGAFILRTENSAAWNAMDSHIGLAFRLQEGLPNAHVLDQYINPANPLAHYDTTAEEILEQAGGKVDIVVVGAGTGGTITGIARKLKKVLPGVVVVGVDPYGSILAQPDTMNDQSERSGLKRLQGYQVEGIGYDFIPSSLDRGIVDKWIKTDDDEGFTLARALIRYEGLMVGGSSGTAMAGCMRYLKDANLMSPDSEKKRIVVMFPDGTRNYMSKFLDPAWREEFKIGEAEDLNLFKQ